MTDTEACRAANGRAAPCVNYESAIAPVETGSAPGQP
jgi:hypothetical protein